MGINASSDPVERLFSLHLFGRTMNERSTSTKSATVNQHNALAWDRLARGGAKLAAPARDADFSAPLATVDPLGWLGGDIRGRRVLCLAAGGGRQSALYASAGAEVTVFDVSPEMLAQDREVAQQRGLRIRTVEGSMENLAALANHEFDIVIQPVSSCYVPDVLAVYQEVARVLRPQGIYISQHKSPASLQTSLAPDAGRYSLCEPYYRSGPLPSANPSRIRESGTLEFLHRWEELLGGMCRSGFVITDVIEPQHNDAHAPAGSFAHRCHYVAPYVRIRAQRRGAGPHAKIHVGNLKS